MATSAIGSADLALLRGFQFTEDVSIDITPLDIVQTGTITAIPSLSPFVNISWDGSTSGIVAGQLVKITSGTTLRAYAVIRKAPSGSTLYISTTPLGSPGYSTDIESTIQVGDTVTVYSHRPIWGLYSRIANRTFYKQWDVAYSNQNSQIPPVANAGAWQKTKITGASASFTLPKGGINSSFAMVGGSVTYLWALPAGVTLQDGYALTDDVIAVDATPGKYLVSLTVTDTNAQTHTAYTWLFVSDGTTGTSLSEDYSVSIDSDSQTREGRTMTLTVTGASLEDVIYPGAGILVKETPNFNGATLTDGVFIDTFIGYVADISYTYDERRIPTASVTIESPLIYASRIPQPTQSLTEDATPASWVEGTSNLTHPRGAVYYAIKWHSPGLLDMHDYDTGSLTTPRRKFIDYNTRSLGEAAKLGASLFLVHIGSASDGTTVLRKYPQYMSNADRNALGIVITWQAQDCKLPLSYGKRLHSALQEATTGAFAYNGTVTKAWKTIKRWNQGMGNASLPDFTVSISDGLQRVKDVVGHFFAEQNADIQEIPLDLTANQDVIDPAYMLWNRLMIDAAYDPAGNGWSNARMIPARVERSWEKSASGIRKAISLVLQPETFGQPGVEVPIGNIKTSVANGWASAAPVPYTAKAGEGIGSIGAAIIIDDNGNMAVTYNYLASSPEWVDLSDNFTGNVCDFDWDYNSDYYANGGIITDKLGVYVVSVSNTTLYVYRIEDIKAAGITVTEVTTATMNDSSVTTEARIVCSETTPTLVIAAWKDQTGTEFIRSTDGGSSWSTKANVGSAVTDTSNDNAALGLDVYGATQLITAPDATPEYGLYVATTAGGAFSAVTNTERVNTPFPMVQFRDSTEALASVIDAGGGSIVTFDGGYSDYTDQGDASFSPAVATGGNPGNCWKGTHGSSPGFVGIRIRVNLGATLTVTDLEFDYYIDIGGTGSASAGTQVEGDSGHGYGSATDATWYHLVASVDDFFWSPPYSASYVDFRITVTNTTGTSYDFRLDNLEIITSEGFGSDVRKVHRVIPVAGAAVWTDISPATNQVPVRPHDLSIDRIDATIINATTENDTWYKSTDSGATWASQEASSNKHAFLTQGDAMIEGGISEVKLSLNGGTSFDDKTGNLAAIWSSVGTIKRVLAI